MAQSTRSGRPGRPGMTIPLPPKFDYTVPVEDEFLTPPIWVASNPPPVFERPEMKRTMSEVSNWDGDDEEEEVSSTSSEPKETEDEEKQVLKNLQRPIKLQERRSQTFSNSTSLRPPVRPQNKRRISDSVATRTRARLLAQQAFSSTVASASEPPSPERDMLQPTTGDRKPVITASALTILTLARSSSNPYSPPVDHEKFSSAGLPLASPFHEKKSFFDGAAKDPIKKYFSVTKSSKKDKEMI